MSTQKLTLAKVIVHNIKSIEDCKIDLGDSNYIFGPNNSGKSNLLFALNLAFGNVRLEREDVFCSKESPFSESKEAYVDLMFRPQDGGEFSEEWAMALGTDISVIPYEYFAFRTSFKYDGRNNSYHRTRQVITDWDGAHNVVGHLKDSEMRLFECFFIDAQRDISDDIGNRQSLWNRRISKMELSDDIRDRFDSAVGELNSDIVNGSPILRRLSEGLAKVPSGGNLVIEPLPSSVSEIYNGLEVRVVEEGKTIPVSSLGLGSRSIATIKSVQMLADMSSETDGPHYTLILMEEPEEHLHPQLQHVISSEIAGIQTQKVLTTHSPRILSGAGIRDMIHCSHDGVRTTFDSGGLGENIGDDAEKNIAYIPPEFLFSNLIVLVEGKTEILAFPVYFKNRFTLPPEAFNVTFVEARGHHYTPFLQLIKEFDLKWLMFSDGDALKDVEEQISQVFNVSAEEFMNGPDRTIFMLPVKDYEYYIAKECYATVYSALSESEGRSLETKLKNKKAFDTNWEKLAQVLKGDKTGNAEPMAKAICDSECIPPLINDLLDQIPRRLTE